MIITIPWLKEHLNTKVSESEIISQLTNIGLEVESIKENSGEMSAFKVAKILKAEKHPNGDKLKVCDITLGDKEILKVVCGAPNAREGLVTIYAPPGAVIPKTKFELKIAKIRGIESRGMLCSESELNLSSESDGIIELKNKEKNIGKSYFNMKSEKSTAQHSGHHRHGPHQRSGLGNRPVLHQSSLQSIARLGSGATRLRCVRRSHRRHGRSRLHRVH